MVDWNKGREFHLQLSEAAADHYDQLYADANFATGSYMQYEIDILERWSQLAPDQELALDLGCGTGRDSFVLARRFDQVYAFDFSPAMIEVASRSKLRKAAGNVLFEVRDVERGLIDIPDGCASMVNSAFGMGSFVQNVESFFREVKRILKPRGIAVFSFYNDRALVNRLNLQWRPALAARAAHDDDVLNVDFGGTTYSIAAQAYNHLEIKRKLQGNFDLLSLTTYPTLSALFPQELFEDAAARDLCTKVDQLLADNLEIAAGPYIVGVVQKNGRTVKKQPLQGYARVLDLLTRHNVPVRMVHHAPVRSMEEVRSVIDAPLSEMVKSIVVAVPRSDRRGESRPQLYLFGIAADRRLDFAKVAMYLGIARKQIRPATQSEVEELTGFTVGSVPPFGLPQRVVTVLDEPLSRKFEVWCGTGRPTESLRVAVSDLQKLSAFSLADVSKGATGGGESVNGVPSFVE